MADKSGPFDASTWAEADWARIAPAWAPSGVIDTPAAGTSTGGFAFSSSGLNVTAGVGRASVRGFGLDRTGTPPTHAVTANSNSTNNRRDRLVLRRDLATHEVTTAVKQGTAAASPVAPSLTQVETGIWEETLFSFLVPPNSATTITGVIDERQWIDPGGKGLVKTPAPAQSYDLVPRSYVDAIAPRLMRAQRTSDAGFNPTVGNSTWEPFSAGTNWTETDPHGMHGTGGEWVFPRDGWYKLSAGCEFRENATGERGLRINPIGALDMGRGDDFPQYLDLVDACAGTATIITSTVPAFFATAGMTAMLEARQTSGSGLVVDHVWIDAIYLGPNNYPG